MKMDFKLYDEKSNKPTKEHIILIMYGYSPDKRLYKKIK